MAKNNFSFGTLRKNNNVNNNEQSEGVVFQYSNNNKYMNQNPNLVTFHSSKKIIPKVKKKKNPNKHNQFHTCRESQFSRKKIKRC